MKNENIELIKKKQVTFEKESTKDVVLHWKTNVPYVSRNIIIHYDPHFTLVFNFPMSKSDINYNFAMHMKANKKHI